VPNPSFQDAERKQVSFLAAVEKKVLVWLAHRMRVWVNSDHLTLLGFAAMFAAGACYWAASVDRRALIGVIAALAVNWFGDSLDGTLARVRNRLRPRYGFYVDHITDAIGTFFLMGGLALSSYMNPFIALGLLIAYFLLSIEVYLTPTPSARFISPSGASALPSSGCCCALGTSPCSIARSASSGIVFCSSMWAARSGSREWP